MKLVLKELIAKMLQYPPIVIRVGTVSVTGSGWTSKSVTFSSPMPNTPFVTLVQTDTHSTENYQITARSTTGFTFAQYTGSTWTSSFIYLAICEA